MRDSSQEPRPTRPSRPRLTKREEDELLTSMDNPEGRAYKEYLEHKEKRKENNRIKNRPIVHLTYFFVLVFLCMFGSIIYYLLHDAESTVANTGNRRQDTMAAMVTRGEIRSADGAVLARTEAKDGKDVRIYPYGETFAHVVGYNSYGKSGIELSTNFQLLTSNENVVDQVKDDLAGRKKPGDNVVTTLDSRLQTAAYKALGKCNGAVVVMEPDTGKILAMVSKPGFDPNKIDEVWEEIHSEEGASSTVLLNRATRGLYAPGSTFKVITTLEYLREHPNADYSYACNGEDSFDGVKIICYKHKAHGNVNLEQSIGYSCNTSFANIGMNDITMAGLRKTAEDCLFNKELPYDGDVLISSFTMDPSKPRTDIPQTVIGQGETQITPLHNALIMSAIANGGVMMKPYLIDHVENVAGDTVRSYSSKSAETIMTSSEAAKLQELLLAPGAYGTAAYKFKNYRHKIVGKTGTAEYDNEGHCNSWFVGYSNPEDPDIVVSVVVEDSDKNNLTGVQVAAAVFETYYP